MTCAFFLSKKIRLCSLNPIQKEHKSVSYSSRNKKKKSYTSYSTHFIPPSRPDYAFRKEIHICSLSLSLCPYCPFRNSPYIYIRVSVSIVHSHRVLKKRDVLYITYHIYQKRFVGLDRLEKRVSRAVCVGKREKIEEEEKENKKPTLILASKKKNGVPNLDRV